MENKKSIFNRFSNIFKSEPWYVPFPQIIQDFAVRFVSNDKAENRLFEQAKKQLLRKYKDLKSNKELSELPDSEGFTKLLDTAIYEDGTILPSLATIGDEEFLSKLFFEIDEKPNSTDLKICIVHNRYCPDEVILNALSSEQPEELRKVALLRDELSYTEKVEALQDALVGNNNLKLKFYFSQNLIPTVSDVPALMDLLAENALNKRELTSLILQYERYIIKISGYTCKSDGSYATADLVLEDTVMFREESQNNEIVQVGTFKNKDGATSFLKKKFGNLPFVVHEFVVSEEELPVEEDVSEETEEVSVAEETTDDKTTCSTKNKRSKKK